MSIIGTLPYNLTNGQTADASQVMSNYNYIVSQVNSNALALTGGVLTGAITSSSGANFSGQLIGGGSTTNDSAAAGIIGEYISSTVLASSAASITSAVAANITTISLTAGDWDIWGSVGIILGTSASLIQAFISTASATNPGTNPNNGGHTALVLSFPAGTSIIPIGTQRLSLATTTTVCLETNVAFAGTASAYGFIGARRRR